MFTELLFSDSILLIKWAVIVRQVFFTVYHTLELHALVSWWCTLLVYALINPRGGVNVMVDRGQHSDQSVATQSATHCVIWHLLIMVDLGFFFSFFLWWPLSLSMACCAMLVIKLWNPKLSSSASMQWCVFAYTLFGAMQTKCCM